MRISKSKRFHSVASLLGMFVLLLQACSATPYQDQQKGVLVADFYADKIGSVLVLAKKDSPKPPAAVIEITPMDNFRVLELPAGDYTWQELREPGQTIPLSDKFDIRVHPGRSNYIGSLLIKSYEGGPKLTIVNQSTEAMKRMQSEQQQVLQSYPFLMNLARQR